MKRKNVFIFLMSLLLLITLVGCNASEKSKEPAKEPAKETAKKFLSIGASDPGTTFYALGSGIGSVIQKELPGTTATVEVTGSAVENVRLLNEDKVDFGFTVSMIPYKAINEQGMKNVKMVFAYQLTSFKLITRKESSINSIEDLKGKKVAIGAPGSSTAMEAEIVLNEYGIGMNGIKAERLNINEAADALKDKTIDAFFLNIADPAAVVTDLATTTGIKFIPYDGPKTKQLLSKYNAFVETVIPAGKYPGQDKEVKTIGSNMVFMTRGDLAEDVVYNVVKALYENQEALIKAHPVGKDVTLKNAMRAAGLPYHPGAIKYFKEKGVWKE